MAIKYLEVADVVLLFADFLFQAPQLVISVFQVLLQAFELLVCVSQLFVGSVEALLVFPERVLSPHQIQRHALIAADFVLNDQVQSEIKFKIELCLLISCFSSSICFSSSGCLFLNGRKQSISELCFKTLASVSLILCL